jgi:PIN domain nuclease of toxin-antitoxin system
MIKRLFHRPIRYHHSDPFDRLQIAQAATESLRILTADDKFKQYGVKLIW